MTSGRRAVLLAAAAATLGGLASASVARRERALRTTVGEPVPVVVTMRPLRAGDRLGTRVLGVRTVPRRYAPAGGYPSPEALDGLRAAVAIPAGTDLQQALVDDGRGPGGGLRAGERVFPVTGVGEPGVIVPGTRVDVLVTEEERAGARLVLRGAEVLAAHDRRSEEEGAPPQVQASLRVRAAQLEPLADATDRARVVRLVALPGPQ